MTPIYVFTGLLDSGKTTLIHEVAGEEDFLEPGKTLLILCEEGETEYQQVFLDKHDMTLISVEEPEQLNDAFWQECEETYQPRQVMIEYNGMWQMDELFQSGMPEHWAVGGIYSTVNGETAEMYLVNMRKLFMEPLRDSNLIIYNRCSEETDRQKYRRTFKALNPQVQVVFERPDGVLYENEEEELPYDYHENPIELHDVDYGLWYLDAMEHPERYMEKEIRFHARYCASIKPGEPYFIPGRHVMTCCEDDIEFLGFLCYFEGTMPYRHGDWVKVSVRFDYGPCEMYGPDEEGPMLHLLAIDAAEQPEQELVTFT